MTEVNILPWVEVNEMMDDVYRQQVVADALGYYPKAPTELNALALQILRQTIKVNGFRTFESIPLQMVRNIVAKEFKSNGDLAAVIVCLWAEKQHDLIETLSRAAREANISVPETWSWHEGSAGFVNTQEPTELDLLANRLSDEKTKPESDHYLLAALWLSRSLVIEEDEEQEAS